MVFHKKLIIPIGMCGLLKRDYLENPDIGFAILPEHTNNGYAYEAAKATINFAKTHLNISHLAGFTIGYNIYSINLLNKLGFTFDRMIQIPNNDEDLMLFVKSF